MDNNWIFDVSDYRKVIEKILMDKGQTRGYRTKLAEAAGCQLAYVSHVLSGHAHFTPDQAMGISDFWNLGDLESEYFMALVSLGRAASPRLTARIQQQLTELRIEHAKTRRSRLSHEPYAKERVIDYYLDWAVSAVHAMLTVPKLRDANLIAKRLQIEDRRVMQIFTLLQELGFATMDQKGLQATSSFFHAADESRYASLHHHNWRRQAERDSEKLNSENDSVHYTALHSLSEEDFKRLRQMIIDFIAQTRQVVAPSPEETVACLTLDWFRV